MASRVHEESCSRMRAAKVKDKWSLVLNDEAK